MKGFTPGLIDRLLGTPTRVGNTQRALIEEMKDMVARDLEALLNTRSVLPDELLEPYPECAASIVSYGLIDFADLSLSSPTDRAHICACIESVIARHEPRLKHVKAALELREDTVNRLNFSITALLVISTAQ